MSNDILGLNTIKEAENDPTPRFYESFSVNPILSVMSGSRPVFRDFIKLVRFKDHEVSVPELDIGTGAIGQASITSQHGINGNTPLLFAQLKEGETYGISPVAAGIAQTIIVSAPIVTGGSYTIQLFNTNNGLGPQTVKLRVFIYELSQRA